MSIPLYKLIYTLRLVEQQPSSHSCYSLLVPLDPAPEAVNIWDYFNTLQLLTEIASVPAYILHMYTSRVNGKGFFYTS